MQLPCPGQTRNQLPCQYEPPTTRCYWAALAATACQKISVSPSEGPVGEWNWVASQGGFTGNQTEAPASTGTTKRWLFRADNTFQLAVTWRRVAQPP